MTGRSYRCSHLSKSIFLFYICTILLVPHCSIICVFRWKIDLTLPVCQSHIHTFIHPVIFKEHSLKYVTKIVGDYLFVCMRIGLITLSMWMDRHSTMLWQKSWLSRQCKRGSNDVVNYHQLFYHEVKFSVHEAREEEETLIAIHCCRSINTLYFWVCVLWQRLSIKLTGRSINSPEQWFPT